MGINHKGKSLKFVFIQYLVSVGGGLLLALGLAVLSFFPVFCLQFCASSRSHGKADIGEQDSSIAIRSF